MAEREQAVVTHEAIRDFSDRIVREFHPRRVILFGSHASGEPGRDSDVDILVEMDHMGKPWEAASEIRRCVRAPFALDLLVRSSAQIRRRLEMGDPFFDEISRKGLVLHETTDK